MMLFCPKCGTILRPKAEHGKTVLLCPCGYKSIEKDDILMKETFRVEKKLEIAGEKSVDTRPKIRQECPECKNMEAYYWLMQTRAADEAETRMFECTKCGHRWREYK